MCYYISDPTFKHICVSNVRFRKNTRKRRLLVAVAAEGRPQVVSADLVSVWLLACKSFANSTQLNIQTKPNLDRLKILVSWILRPNAKPNILILWKPPQTRFRLQATHDSCQSGKRLGRNKVTSFTRSSGRLIFLVKHHKREEPFKKGKSLRFLHTFFKLQIATKLTKSCSQGKSSSQPHTSQVSLNSHLQNFNFCIIWQIKKIQFICSSQMIINVGPIERALLHKSAMLVKVEPADSGGSFESAIVPRIKETLLQPSKLQVFSFKTKLQVFLTFKALLWTSSTI